MKNKLLNTCRSVGIAFALIMSISLFAPGNTYAQTPNSTVYALAIDPGLGTQQQRLISFDVSSPGTLLSDRVISGLGAGEILKGIDFRPATGELFALAIAPSPTLGGNSTSRLYRIDLGSGFATPVGSGITPSIGANNFVAFNFNPVPDRIRAVGNVSKQNIRINPNDGTTAGTDTNVAYASGDPNASDLPNIVALAYNNNNAGATSTTAFGIDARPTGAIANVRLVTIGTRDFPNTPASGTAVSPNTGQLFTVANVTTSGGGALMTNNFVGFDITSSGVAYISLTPPVPFNSVSSFYTLDTTSGTATLVGRIGGGVRVSSLSVATTTTSNPNPTLANIQFSPTTYTVAKNAGSVTLTVVRTGDTSQAQTVRFSTVGGSATAQRNFEGAAGTITFNPGETSKTITVFITNNSFVEGNRTFTVVLTDPNGGTASGPGQTATVTVTDTNTTPSDTNPIDQRDFFIRQQYRDFLNREADAAGLAFWAAQYDTRTNACLSINNQTERRKCILRARASISAAFFLSTEFQQTGYLVYRTYDVAFGRVGVPRPALGQPVSQVALRFEEYLADESDVSNGVVIGQPGSDRTLETNITAFLNRFVQRSAFIARYPTSQTADQFVDALFATAGFTPSASDRQAAITAFGSGGTTGRAAALRSVANTETVFQREFNRAFVLMEYFGYLRRNPDDAPEPCRCLDGYNFWLRKLDSFTQAGENVRDQAVVLRRVQRAEMIEAFIDSNEYRSRFGPVTRPSAPISR
ncbi:MAG: hypothetical protein NVSMB56_12310 [Pyrinomonadaceae bacterium]